MPRRVPSLERVPARPSAVALATALALALALLPASVGGPASVAQANAAGPPDVERLDGIPLIGEFVAPGGSTDHLVLIWDEILDPRFVPDSGDFAITVHDVVDVTHPVAEVELLFSGLASDSFGFGDDGVSFMRLDLPAGVTLDEGDSISVDYVPGTTPVRDLALNAAGPFSDVEAIVGDLGAFGPVVAVVDSYHGADKVVVALSDPIEASSLPAPGQFTVTVSDVGDVPVDAVTDLYPEIGMALIELDLPSPITNPAATVLVDYTSQPGILVSRYRGETLGDQVDLEATVIIASNATAATVNSGDSLSTATGAGPTPGDPVETTITSAAAGDASISEGSVDEPAPAGYGFFGHQVVIELPDAPDPATPNVLQFGIDASAVPAGQNESTVQVFRNGVLVPDCAGPPGVADPSPCLSDRQALGNGDISLTVLTVQASTWNLGILVPYEFDGFFAPVDNDVPNVVNAGRAIPVKFSLGGDRGPDIFAVPPYVRSISCDDLEDGDVIEETLTAGSSGLQYDAASDTYTYAWKTNRLWAGSCKRLVLEFADGTVQTATFDFRR